MNTPSICICVLPKRARRHVGGYRNVSDQIRSAQYNNMGVGGGARKRSRCAKVRCDGNATAATDNNIGGSAVSALNGTEAVRTSTWVA